MNKINKTDTSPALPLLVNSMRYAPAGKVMAINKLIKLKKDKGPWGVIKEIVKIWVKERPEEYRSFVITQKETRELAKLKTKHRHSGISVDKKTGSMLRATYDIPVKVIKMIRRMYSPEELPMDKKFYNKLGKLFPDFKVSEKL